MLLLVSGSEIGKRLTQHRGVVDAAKRSGVGLLLYTSVLHADTSQLAVADEHIGTEHYIAESGIGHLILRNCWYTEKYTAGLDRVISSGVLYGAAGKGRVAAAPRGDYAEAAAVLLTEDHGVNRVFELCGDEPFTYDELAAAIAKVSGTDVVYQNMDADAYTRALVEAGMDLASATGIADGDEGVARGDLDSNSTDLVDLIHRPTVSLLDALRAAII